MAVELFKCGRCRTHLPREAFYRNVTNVDDRSAFCRECAKADSRVRRLANKAANLEKRNAA